MKIISTEINNCPLVSIVIPVYNGANYVGSALQSCLNQTYKKIEIVVVNDGSRDSGATENVINFFLKDKRVRYFFKENGGVSSALNYGISKSEGAYITWLSHDDLFSNDKIEAQIVHLSKRANIISYTKTIPISGSGERLSFATKFFINRLFLKKKIISGPKAYFDNKLPFYGSLLIPRSFLENHPFNCELRYGQDIFSIFEMLIDTNYKIERCKGGATYYRVHKTSGNFTRINDYIVEQKKKNDLYVSYILKHKDSKKILKLYYYSNCRLAAHYDTNIDIALDVLALLKRYYRNTTHIRLKGYLIFHTFKFLWKIKRFMTK